MAIKTSYINCNRADKTSTFHGNTKMHGDLEILGSFTFGDASVDKFILKGRMSTMTAAGAAVDLGSTYTYGEYVEMRCTVSSWTGIAGDFKGYYFRAETTAGNASYGIRGMEIFSVANITSGTTGLNSHQGLYVESALKHGAASWTLGGYGSAIEANISIYAGAGTLTLTNDYAGLKVKIQGANGVADYTKFNGIIIQCRDGDSASRVFGDAISIEDAEAFTSDWTNGIYIANGTIKSKGKAICIDGGSQTCKGIFIGADDDSAGSGIKLVGADWDTAQGNAFYCDDGGTALTGYTECFTARMLTTATVSTGDVSTAAIHSDLTLNANYTGSGGLSSIWGNTTIKAGKTVDVSGGIGDVGGGTFGIDIVGTLAANSHACGVSVGVGGSGTKTGILSGFRIRAATGTVDWDAILSIEDGDGSWTSLTTAAASQTATMTNSPKSGDPAYWLNVYIGETKYIIPLWLAA